LYFYGDCYVMLVRVFHEVLVEDLDPKSRVSKTIRLKDDKLVVPGYEPIPVPEKCVHVIGFGKAAYKMLLGLVDSIGLERVCGGLIVVPRGYGDYPASVGPVRILESSHPLPDESSLKAGLELLDYVSKLDASSVVVALVSGGGSSLVEVPEDGLELEDVVEATRLLMEAGASIHELNIVRKHLSAIKGGKLLRRMRARTIVNLVVSDVVGDDPTMVASGPTLPDEHTFSDARRVLVSRGVWSRLGDRVRGFIEAGCRGEVPGTLSPSEASNYIMATRIILRNRDALESFARRLSGIGFQPFILTDMVQGEAREAGKLLAGVMASALRGHWGIERPFTVIAGGETTVTLSGERGVGGRCQELCLSMALTLKELKADEYYVLCAGTDGIDGNSPAAGAIADHKLVDEAYSAGLDPYKHLEKHDTFTLFFKLKRSVITGPTGTNVNDVVVFVAPRL